MKIKLFYPPAWIRFNPIPPMGITTLTESLIRQGHDVNQVDLELKCWLHNQQSQKRINMEFITDINNVSTAISNSALRDKNGINILLDMIGEDSFDLAGFSIMGSDQLLPSLLLANRIKKTSGAKVAFGGCFASNFANDILKTYNSVDYISMGDSWTSFPQLVSAVGEGTPLENVKSLAYRSGKEIKKTQLLRHDIESMPILNLDGLPLENYKKRLKAVYRNGFDSLVLQYYVSSGCINKCAFCRRPNLGDFQIKSPEKVVKELKMLSEKYDVKYFKLETNEINPSEKYLVHLCDEIGKRKLEIFWHAYARLDGLSKATIEKMYASGCRVIRFGVETGSQRLLDKMNKRYRLEEMERILRDSHEVGIWNAIYLLVGLPEENQNDIDQTIEFIQRNQEHIHGAAINIYFLLRGTDIYLHPDRYGIQMLNPNDQDIGFDELSGLKWEQKKRFVIDSVKKIEEVLLNYDIGLTAVCTDLMFTTLIQEGNREKANKSLRRIHPYLFEKIPHHFARWKIYHSKEAPPEGFKNWYYEKRMGGTVFGKKEMRY